MERKAPHLRTSSHSHRGPRSRRPYLPRPTRLLWASADGSGTLIASDTPRGPRFNRFTPSGDVA